MSRRIAVAAAWVLATLGSILIASAAVGSVRNQVSDTPSPLRSASVTRVIAVASSTTSSPESSTPDPELASSTTTTSPTITPPASTSTSTTTTSPSVTPTTAPATTTTIGSPPTTAAPATTTTSVPEQVLTYPQVGGTTTIRTDGGGVYLVAAVPTSGFQVDVEDSGPDEVSVRYRSESHTSKFKAEWEHGTLEVDTDEDDEDDD